MEAKLNYEFYEKKLHHYWNYEDCYATYEEFRDATVKLLEMAFENGYHEGFVDGAKSYDDYDTEERARFDAEEGQRTAWEIIDG